MPDGYSERVSEREKERERERESERERARERESERERARERKRERGLTVVQPIERICLKRLTMLALQFPQLEPMNEDGYISG